jgi:EmrB/QacA subfamily drug resistance transporter
MGGVVGTRISPSLLPASTVLHSGCMNNENVVSPPHPHSPAVARRTCPDTRRSNGSKPAGARPRALRREPQNGRARTARTETTPQPQAAAAARTGLLSPRNLLLVLVCMAQFMIVLDVSIVNVALPSIRNDLHFSTTGLQWVVSAYTLTFAGFLMLGGRMSDLLGHRRMFLIGTTAFAVTSLVCAVASSRGLLLGARGLQGLAGAVVSPATLAILTTSFADGPERNRAVGIWGAMSGLGASAGALLGGVLTATVGWQSIFLVNVPIGIVVVLAGRRVITEGRRQQERHFDVLGAVLITLGLLGVVYGIVRSTSLGWVSMGALGPIITGLAMLALFAFVEHRVARAPLVPLSIFRRSQLRAANLIILLLYAALFSTFYFVTLYMQQVLHYSALRAGLGFLPMTLGVFAASRLAPSAISRFGARGTVTAGMLSAAAGMALFTGVHPHAGYLVVLLPGSLLAAAGMGLALVSATVAAVQGVPTEESGLASGLVNSSRFIGGALGLAALSTLAASQTHTAIAAGSTGFQALTDGYGIAFRAATVICVIGAALAAGLLRQAKPAIRANASVASEPGRG